MDKVTYWVGIDVSKHYLDVYIRPNGKAFRQPNTEQGIATVVEHLQAVQPELVVLEATGGMEVPAAVALSSVDLAVAIVNPRQVRDFALIHRQTGEDRCH
ncbi:MAG: hypothetical protein N4J56_007852 [Chroococcidiopsis sp. SAG 2025]|nr:hypothetical protein [Chroococcidiopsis sp. SAG 2025]